VTQLDAKLMERGLASDPDLIPTLNGAIVSVRKIIYYKGPCNSKVKLHSKYIQRSASQMNSYSGAYYCYGDCNILW
jgi:hypothetical protein